VIDDVAATIGAMLAIAFSEGMENFHADEPVTKVFNKAAKEANLDTSFKQLYRELLIAGSLTTVCLFTRIDGVVVPKIGVLEGERVRVIGTDFFGDAELAYVPPAGLKQWLDEFHAERTTAARQAEMRREDPVSAALFMGPVQVTNREDLIGVTTDAYRLNPRMAHRLKMPGDGAYPRPLLTGNFALLEAKRLLNLMDYALLQGGVNFIVVAKKGTDERPALPEEVENLRNVVRGATRTGVIVGDHRLSFEIITPNMDALLSEEKRTLLGRKIAMRLLRLPEHSSDQAGQEGQRSDVEILSRVIASDRQDIRRHVERHVYGEIAKRNRLDTEDGARIWFPKIILQGSNYFTDYVLKLRDRGDIPRKFAVEAGGFDWDASVEQRKRELEEGIDDTMAPAAVPFSSPEAGPQDNNDGRPVGSSPDNGAPNAQPGGTSIDPAAPRRTITRNSGETVRAILDGDETRRVGERTYEILAEYEERSVGRVTPIERRALESGAAVKDGPTAVVPVNPGYRVTDLKAVRLATGLSMIVGRRRGDGALVAKALSFREPEYDLLGAEEMAVRWGFPVKGWRLGDEPQRDGSVRRRFEKDEAGEIVGVVEERA
jgi:hypothetical protein